MAGLVNLMWDLGYSQLSTEIHLAVCINSPAARLCLIEDVGM